MTILIPVVGLLSTTLSLLLLPYHESWAQSLDRRLADPILALVYTG